MAKTPDNWFQSRLFGNDLHENLAGLVFMYTEGVLAGRVPRFALARALAVAVTLADGIPRLALALAHPDPNDLLRLANERLYRLRDRATGPKAGSFVALGYLGFVADGGRLRYSLAGQPPPLDHRCGRGAPPDRSADRAPWARSSGSTRPVTRWR